MNEEKSFNRFSRSIFACLLCWLVVYSVHSQQPPQGTWRAWSSFYSPRGVVKRGDTIYCSTTGGLFAYEIATGNTQTWTTVDGLSGINNSYNNTSSIYLDTTSGYIFIGYPDGMIDYFLNPDEIRGITDIHRSESFTAKSIRKMRSADSILYIAAEFGIIAYDIYKKETKSSYTKIDSNSTGSPVYAIEIYHDSIFAAMGSSGLYGASLNHPNLSDPDAWGKISGLNGLQTGTCLFLGYAQDRLFAVIDDSTMQMVNGEWKTCKLSKRPLRFFDSDNNIVISCYEKIAEIYYPLQDSLVTADNEGNQVCAMGHDEYIWIGDIGAGLLRFHNGGFSRVSPPGPLNNNCYKIMAGRNEFYIAPSGRGGSAVVYDPSGFYYCNSAENEWKNFNVMTGSLSLDLFHGFTCGYYDPVSEKAWLGSTGQGIVEMYKGDTVKTYNGYNSGIRFSVPNDIRITALTLDSENSLWAACIIANGERTLQQKTADGNWYEYQAPGSRPIGLTTDEYGQVWVANEGLGVTVYSDKGTPADISDDQTRNLTNNIGNGNLPSNDVLCVARDKKGQMWVGTGDGVIVFYDAFSVFTQNFPDGSCPVFENQCLLKFQKAKDICVDGANRKWIASEEGAFLMNEDGTKLIRHFTVDNCPLPSNLIYDIEIDPHSGEIFFATDKGAVSYMGDASEGYSNADSLFVFPNPVLPDFEGEVIIRGMAEGSKVKVASTSGRLVKEMDSLGGQVAWDCRDAWGNRVKSGVYLVFVADKEGKNSGVVELAIINSQ